MITTKTVFVLGAGASKPYGLPLGSELCQSVIKEFEGDTDEKKDFLKIAPFSDGHIQGFVNSLKCSGLTSVDAFLERRAEFIDVGKAIIAFELLRQEKNELLWGGNSNWMRYLYQHLAAPTLEEFAQNDVGFITYNYDRTLEQFMLTALTNTYGKDETTCVEILADIPIIHLHGRLGYLPWQRKAMYVPFQSRTPINPRTIEVCQQEIRIVHEDIGDRDDEFKSARSLLRNARRIYFMGFGYAPQNVERLNYDSVEAMEAEGTAYRLTQMECSRVRALFEEKPFTLQNMDCSDFLRERVNFT